MDKEFVPHAESLELKELGFDEPCILLCRGLDTQPVCQMGYEFKTEKNSDYNDETNYWLTVPTYSQAIDFLYIYSNKQIDIQIKGSDSYEERNRKIRQGCKDLRHLQNSKPK